MAVKRLNGKLAAILAADIVGYSRLICKNEAGTLEQLNTLRKEVFVSRMMEAPSQLIA